jgi:transposase-like protein
MRPVPAEDRQKIISLYKDGMTRTAIAKAVGWSEGTVHNDIKAAGVQGAGRVTGIRTDPATEALIMELYGQALKASRSILDNEQFSAGKMRPYSTLAVYSLRPAERFR